MRYLVRPSKGTGLRDYFAPATPIQAGLFMILDSNMFFRHQHNSLVSIVGFETKCSGHLVLVHENMTDAVDETEAQTAQALP